MLSVNEFRKKYYVGTTTNHTGKMKGLASMSTAVTANPFCIARQHMPGAVCKKCYSEVMCRQYTNLNAMLTANSFALTSVIIPAEDIPRLESAPGYFRFESFGDLFPYRQGGGFQVINYFHMAAANPRTLFALWTKNPWVIAWTLRDYPELQKPANLRIIGSSYRVNEDMSEYYHKFPFIDNCFTVYDPEYIAENGVNITCGARSCADCGKCYAGGHTEFNITEKLK